METPVIEPMILQTGGEQANHYTMSLLLSVAVLKTISVIYWNIRL